jgi:hypothetical protein
VDLDSFANKPSIHTDTIASLIRSASDESKSSLSEAQKKPSKIQITIGSDDPNSKIRRKQSKHHHRIEQSIHLLIFLVKTSWRLPRKHGFQL